MINFDDFFVDGELKNILHSRNDPWIGTNFEGYIKLSQKKMGDFGEILVSKIMEKNGSDVCPRMHSDHDRVIDGYKTEIKFSLSVTKNKFIFNHLACHKDWERLILLGMNPNNEYKMNWIYKEDFINNIQSDNSVFNHQQGGKGGKNDDYIFSKKYSALEKTGILNEMETWFMDGKKKIGIELWM